jgi:omega-amidase
MRLTLALAQADFELAQPENNYKKATRMIKEAADKGADLVLLPELWASGYDLPNREKYASSITSGWFARMQSAAVEHRIALGGSLIENDRGLFYNTFIFLDSDGSTLGAYRKIHLFQLLKEEDYFQAGVELVRLEFKSAKIGLATCYDLRFPELFRGYAAAGADLILIPAEWPEKRIQHWNILLQARAIENQCYVAGVNKVGHSQGEKLGGSSAVVGPLGECLVLGGDEEALLFAEIDLDQVKKIRRWMPVLKDSKPSLYKRFLSP